MVARTCSMSETPMEVFFYVFSLSLKCTYIIAITVTFYLHNNNNNDNNCSPYTMTVFSYLCDGEKNST